MIELKKELIRFVMRFGFVLAVTVTLISCQDKETGNIYGYSVLDFGAVGDSVKVNTEQIQRAINVCAKKGGGKVYFPAGNYITGTITLKDNINLFLEAGATIVGSTNPSDYPRQKRPEYRSQKDPGGWHALIYGEGLKNISITGHGTIDGNGAAHKSQPHLLGGDQDGRPRNILFISCEKVKVTGITLKNSGSWNQHYLNCDDVFVNDVKVYNHSNRNNDAIDIDGCRNVTITNSIFDSDDDGITLKSTGMAPTENVAITNCVVSSFCNAIKAGTESTGGFKNITISNCIIKPSSSTVPPVFNTSEHGITGISLEIVDGGIMEGVTISNVTIQGTDSPLYIRLGNRARKYIEEAPEPKVGKMRNISIQNLLAYDTGNFSNSITAVPGSYIENVLLNNVQFYNKGGIGKDDFIPSYSDVKEKEKAYPQPTVWGNLPSSLLFIRHVKNLMVDNMIFGSVNDDPRIPIIGVDVHNISIKNSMFKGAGTKETFSLFNSSSKVNVEKPHNWTGNYNVKD